MKQLLCALCVLAMGFAMVGMARAADEKPKKKADPEAAFKKMDTNGDGKLSFEEFSAKKENKDMAEKAFKAKDKDGDKALCLEEFKAPPQKKEGGAKKKKKE
jgi:Ca2+-binding EF-hand superfamily protein